MGAQNRGKDGKNTESRRIYPQWVQSTDLTGTLSCQQPDLQQMEGKIICELSPTPEEERPYEENMTIDRKRHDRKMEVYNASQLTPRDVFVVRNQGMCFFACSYSQLEVRILAHLSGDPNMISLFRGNSKSDIYQQMQLSKGVIRDLIRWGDSAKVEAKDEFFSIYQHAKAWMDGTKGCARRKSYVETIFGRKIYLGDDSGYSATEIEERERQVSALVEEFKDSFKMIVAPPSTSIVSTCLSTGNQYCYKRQCH